MSKPSIETLPIFVNDKWEMVPQRQYITFKAAALTIKHKVSITKDHIKVMLVNISEGKSLTGENEKVWEDVWEELSADVSMAQELTAQALEEKNAAEEKARAEAEAAKEKELALVKAATEGTTATFTSLSELFDVGNMDRCIAKEGTTDEQVLSALASTLTLEEFSNWAKGDLMVELSNRGIEHPVVQLCEATGANYKSLHKMAITARNVPPEQRKAGVAFTTYAEIATATYDPKPDQNAVKMQSLIEKVGEKVKTADKAADETANQGIIATAQDARKAVQAAQGKTPPPADPLAVNLDKDQFFVVSPDLDLKVAVGFPTDLAKEDVWTIIHVKTARRCYDYTTKDGPKWTPIDKYEHPAPPAKAPEPTAAEKKAAAEAEKAKAKEAKDAEKAKAKADKDAKKAAK